MARNPSATATSVGGFPYKLVLPGNSVETELPAAGYTDSVITSRDSVMAHCDVTTAMSPAGLVETVLGWPGSSRRVVVPSSSTTVR